MSNQKERVKRSKFTTGVKSRDSQGIKGFRSTDKVLNKRSQINQHYKKAPVKQSIPGEKSLANDRNHNQKNIQNNTQLVEFLSYILEGAKTKEANVRRNQVYLQCGSAQYSRNHETKGQAHHPESSDYKFRNLQRIHRGRQLHHCRNEITPRNLRTTIRSEIKL